MSGVCANVLTVSAWSQPQRTSFTHYYYPMAISAHHKKQKHSNKYTTTNNVCKNNLEASQSFDRNNSQYDDIQSRAKAETLRWVDNFVVPLKLCPWAAASMDAYYTCNTQQDPDDNASISIAANNNAKEKQHTCSSSRSSVQIRMVDIPSESSAVEAQDIFTEAVRIEAEGMSAMEDAARSNNGDDDSYNPNVAITFVVAVSKKTTEDADGNKGADKNGDDKISTVFEDFHTFHDSVVYMEEEYLPSIPIEIAKSDEQEVSNDAEDDDDMETLADRVAIAGFHPQWEYVSPTATCTNDGKSDISNSMEEEEQEVVQLNAISYEKRSPYPTVTIVHWSAIDTKSNEQEHEYDLGLVQHITERIAEYNSEVLSKLGVNALEEIYVRDVLLDP